MTRADYVAAEPSNLTKGQVFALAESIANQLHYQPGNDLRALVESVGGTVRVEDTLTLDRDKSGSLYVDGPDKFSIIVPAHTSPRRDRFTIAHEFGHFIVHYMWRRQAGRGTPPDKMVAFRRGSERVEWEANWFAAAFLMPSSAFKEQFSKRGGRLSEVAEVFGVSESAAQVRARQLGLAQ